MKSKEKKNKLKKKESKQHEMGDTPQSGNENPPQSCEEGQDTTLCSESSVRSSSSRKKNRERKRAATKSNENCPPQEGNDAIDTHQILDSLEPPEKVKKNKKRKQQALPGIHSSESPLSGRSAPEIINGGQTQKRSNVETTTDQKCKATSRNDGGISQRRRQNPLSLQQSNIVLYNSSPLSSPNPLSKPKRNAKVNGGKTEDMNGMSDHSQDLFITQKKFVSPHSSSQDSPLLGQKQGSGIRDWMRSQNPPLLLSQFSCLTRNSLDRSNGSNQQVILREKATQTDDDSLTYLALMSFVKKVKVLEPCSEEAQDLSLPSRTRAKKGASSPDNDVIIVESQSPPTGTKASIKTKIKFCFSPLQKAEETKFVQTVLNSSYFFKGKGEPGEANPPITPLLKIKEKPKKKKKKIHCSHQRKTKAT